VYIRRESDSSLDAEIIKKLANYKSKYGKNVVKLTVDPIELSSSEVRARIAATGTAKGLVPNAVNDYIIEKGLCQPLFSTLSAKMRTFYYS
jgi:nicotinic acid mononucleotide adenylyltransferase